MSRSTLLTLLLLAVTATASFAVPAINEGGVVNAATYFPDWHPQSGIAQGSIFVIFGQALGPEPLVVVSEFPVPTELGGTSVEVQAGGGTFQCPVIYTSAG